MLGNRFVGIFLDEVKKWEKSLNLVNDCIDIWFKVQAKWQVSARSFAPTHQFVASTSSQKDYLSDQSHSQQYLESIFVGSADIRRQLPAEAKAFDKVDKVWRDIMTSTGKNPICVEACTADNRRDVLELTSDRLDECQKSLSEYLETKRNSFPRFFFVSDDELLSVLGSSDPTGIQQHLLKLFVNCALLDFVRGGGGVAGMKSAEGEAYKFIKNTNVDGPVEIWMTAVDLEMKSSLREIHKKGVFSYAKEDRIHWIETHLGMVTVLGSQVWWTWETENTFKKVVKGNKYAMKVCTSKNAQILRVKTSPPRRPNSHPNSNLPRLTGLLD